jgi:tripartite-type tricarboxylate transporter receptor subunit TctC
VPPVMPYAQNGTAKCLLLTTVDGSDKLPAASGVGALGIPQAESVLWHGLVAPKGVPEDRLRILTAAFQKAAQSDKFRTFSESQGGKVVASDGPTFDRVMRKEYDEIAVVMARLGLAKTSNGGTGPKQ